MKRYRVYGLTGGIAAGKTLAARFFAEAGIPVIDADHIAHQLIAPGGKAREQVMKRFGTAERRELRQIIYNDPKARRDLEAITHPLIKSESTAEMEKIAERSPDREPVIIYEAALLVETGQVKELDGLIVVEASRQARIERLTTRDGITAELAEKMIDSQTSDEKRRNAATFVLENSGTGEELRARVRELVVRFTKS